MRRSKRKKERLINGKNAIGIFVVVMMLASGVGFILNMNQGSINANKYNGYLFKSDTSSNWWTTIEGKQFMFYFHPSYSGSFNVSDAVVERVKNAEIVYITYDPDDRYVTAIEDLKFDLQTDFDSYFGIIPEAGVTRLTNEYYAHNMIDCYDGTANAPVLKFETGEKVEFNYVGNCIIISSNDNSGFKVARDRLFLGMLDIVEKDIDQE